MKKLVAIALLLLVSLTTFSGNIKEWDECYEQMDDGKETCQDTKQKNKEIKEFTLAKNKKLFIQIQTIYRHAIQHVCIFPAPIINRQTPPPDLV